MALSDLAISGLRFACTAGLLVAALTPASAQDAAVPRPPTPPACRAPGDLIRFTLPLPHTARRLGRGEPLTIVAIGSSSTAGAGASSPAASYPSRLLAELQRQFPGRPVTVINRGVNGEELTDMLARFEENVVKEKPDLVLWQLGTNSVLRDHPLDEVSKGIRAGVKRLKEIGADVVLIDPQYAPRVIAKPQIAAMVHLISAAAKETNVDIFQRFAVMRYWHDDERLSFPVFVSPDDLHLNDWSYACFAKLIGSAIAEAATRGIASAAVVSHRSAP
jgi:acyl-CoA thioesterase-1